VILPLHDETHNRSTVVEEIWLIEINLFSSFREDEKKLGLHFNQLAPDNLIFNLAFISVS
jgi:hypothetical protein